VFPYSTFNWIGLDGSQVLSHMTPVDSYNSQADVDELVKGTTKHKNLEVTDQALLLFGNGDGGGGSTSLMLEKVGVNGQTGEAAFDGPNHSDRPIAIGRCLEL
jgi:alpha-mannosidase